MVTRICFFGLLAVLCVTVTACGKVETIKSDSPTAGRKASDAKDVRDNAVWGQSVQANDKANELQKAVEAQAAENAKKIDEATK